MDLTAALSFVIPLGCNMSAIEMLCGKWNPPSDNSADPPDSLYYKFGDLRMSLCDPEPDVLVQKTSPFSFEMKQTGFGRLLEYAKSVIFYPCVGTSWNIKFTADSELVDSFSFPLDSSSSAVNGVERPTHL